MLIDRIVRAFSFKKGVYAEVAKDETFTPTAYGLIALMAISGALVSQAAAGAGFSLLGAVGYSLFYAAGLAFLVFVINLVCVSYFKGTGSYSGLLRAAALAITWLLLSNAFSLLGGMVPFLRFALTCAGVLMLLVFLAALSVATGEVHAMAIGSAVAAVLVTVAALAILVFCVASLFLMAL
jgi:hypothetical protein